MEIEDIVEIFAATIIIAMGGLIVLSIYAPDLGSVVRNFLPTLVKLLIYLALTFAVVVAVKDALKI